MSTTALRPLHWLKHSFGAVVAAALLTACASEAPVGPDRRPASSAQLTAAPTVAGAELGACESLLRLPEGSTFSYHAYAKGVQLYRWTGSQWLPAGPRALLYADAEGKALVGHHYVGPKWKSLGGSVVAGAVRAKCPVGPNDVDWLLLDATPEGGAGVFQHTTLIHRVNTVGGVKPNYDGIFVDEVRESPYTAEYYFYRAQ